MSFASKKTRVKRLLSSKESRRAYVFENLKRLIPFQIRTMRDERGWSQEKAAAELGKLQSVISRLESPAYGKMTLQTLIDVANGFDVGLLIKFVPFSRLVKEYEDLSPSGLSAPSVSDSEEKGKLLAWETAPSIRSAWVTVSTPIPKPIEFAGATSNVVTVHYGFRRSPVHAIWEEPIVIHDPLTTIEQNVSFSESIPKFLPSFSTSEVLDYTSTPVS